MRIKGGFSMAIFAVTIVFVIILTSLLALYLGTAQQVSLPPGPPADPIIGHLRIIPTTNQGRVFHSWSKLYGKHLCFLVEFLTVHAGDVIHLRLPRTSIIILNSVQAANDLLDKSGANFSNRPKCVVFEL